jgi:hypothetical protein
MRGCRTFRTIELTLLFPAGHCAGLTDIVATGEVLGVAPGAVGLSARGTLVQIHYYKIVLVGEDGPIRGHRYKLPGHCWESSGESLAQLKD